MKYVTVISEYLKAHKDLFPHEGSRPCDVGTPSLVKKLVLYEENFLSVYLKKKQNKVQEWLLDNSYQGLLSMVDDTFRTENEQEIFAIQLKSSLFPRPTD